MCDIIYKLINDYPSILIYVSSTCTISKLFDTYFSPIDLHKKQNSATVPLHWYILSSDGGNNQRQHMVLE